MTAILLALTLAHHNPYHWTMSCKRFHEVSIEIMMDKHLDYRAKQHLIKKFRGKVEEQCDSVLI
jgi:ribosomal protein L31